MALGDERDVLILEPAPREASDRNVLAQLASISNVERINARIIRQHRNVLAALAILGEKPDALTAAPAALDADAATTYSETQIQAIADKVDSIIEKLDEVIEAVNDTNTLLFALQAVAADQITSISED